MSEEKMCKNCEYYDQKAQECHRYAPQPVEQDMQKKIRWPITPPIGWCGECRRKKTE
jgi:hypothetical protein